MTKAKLHTPQFVEKLCAAQAAMNTARHNSSNPHFRRSYADMQSVIEATMPAFVQAGLAIYQDIEQDGDSVTATTIITDGVTTIEVAPVKIPTTGNQNVTAQSVGAALTYARRYSWMTATGVPVGDDKDSIDQQPAEMPQRASSRPQEPRSAPSSAKPPNQVQNASESQPAPNNWQLFTDWLAEQIRTLTDVSDVIGEEATPASVVAFVKDNGIVGWGAFQDYLMQQWSGQGDGPPPELDDDLPDWPSAAERGLEGMPQSQMEH